MKRSLYELHAVPHAGRYAVHEVFLSVQGEGHHTGARAVFVRFSGCNVWTGREQDRDASAENSCCAKWCDTEFFGVSGSLGGIYDAVHLADVVVATWSHASAPTVILTGGEPSLQVDDTLIQHLKARRCTIHVETNGARPLPGGVDWVTVSPKPPSPVATQRYDEVKVVYPAFVPKDFEHISERRYVQPLHDESGSSIRDCVRFVTENPMWRISVQTHKIMGVR